MGEPMDDKRTIAIIGGTGSLGSGLASRWAAAGHRIVIGSRDRARAAEFAASLSNERVTGTDNLAAAHEGSIVVISVPWPTHDAILRDIRDGVGGKIVIDAVVPLVPPRVSVAQLPPEGSAAQSAQRLLGDNVRVTSAFHNIGASKLHAAGPIECDVLVFGNDKEARETVIALAADAQMRGIDGGPLANSAAAEAMTSILIGINRRYKVDNAGIRITGVAL